MACKVSIFSKGQQAENVSSTRLCKITYLLWKLTDVLHFFSILTIFYDYYLFDFNQFHFLMKRICKDATLIFFRTNLFIMNYCLFWNTETFSSKSMYGRQFWGVLVFCRYDYRNKNQSICIAFGKIITDKIT